MPDAPTIRTPPTAALWLLAAALPGCLSAGAADWPQFRGPSRHGVADGAGLLRAWGDGEPRELWRRPIGGGYSSVSAVGERLYTMAVDGEDEVVLCLDAATGETLWQRAVGKTGEAFPEDGPRSTPTVVGQVLFTATSQGRMMALRTSDGEPLWEADLSEYGPPPRFGYSVSPLVDGDLVLMEVGKPDSEPGVVALDRRSGTVRWTALEGPAGYSSPIAIDLAGVRQYVFYRRTRAEVVSLSTAGEVLWRHPTKGLAIIVSPIFLPPDRIFVATSDDPMGGLMLRVTRAAGGFEVEEAWTERLMRNHFNAAVAVGGDLYGFDNATLRCLDGETGARRWAKRGLGKGSLVAAGDLLYVLADDGTLVLVEASPDAYHELGRVQAMHGRAWTAPSLADGRLYVRDSDELVSFEVGGRAAAAAPAPPLASSPSPAASVPEVAAMSAEEIVARYVEARGGAERWSVLEGLVLRGRYAAFSEPSDFTLLRARGDLYRLDFELMGSRVTRARDGLGTWGQHPLLTEGPTRIDEGPYKTQFERESIFVPPLVGYSERGIRVAAAGAGEIDGTPTVALEVTLPDGQQETWHLDAVSFREVAVDSTVMDLTQLPEPMRQRAFYSDFREVDGLVLPFRVDLEFGARLETMSVAEVEIDPALDADAFAGPPPAPAPAAGEGAGAGGGG